jgi:hypothetical protein
MKQRFTWLAIGVCCVWLPVTVRADVLVLRGGPRVDGQLISVHDGVVEFEARGTGGRERMKVDRADVLRIELDEDQRGRTDLDTRDSRDDRDVRDGRSDGRDTRDSRDDRDARDSRSDDRGRPSGLRERDVSVDSWVAWKDTGVEVRAGQTMYFNATGRVRWGPNRQDGPGGERNSPRNDQRPMPGRPAAALIGRIGDGDEPFFIGEDQGAIRIRTSGRLYLGVNDDYIKDNTGSFRVTVYY